MKVKKWLALLLALVMVFSLAACGKDEPAEDEAGGKTLETAAKDYTGDWICVRMESEGFAMSIKDMTEMDESETSMNIAADGKLTMDSGDAVTATWKEVDTGIELTADDPETMGAETLILAYDEAADTLTLDFEDLIMVFARKGSETETESRNTNYFDLDEALNTVVESEEYPQVTLAVGTPSTTTFSGETLSAKVNGEFTAQKPGDYTFWAEGDQDTYATLYSDAEHTNTLATGDDENGTNFVITYTMAKAETVYLEAGLYFTNSGDLTINVALAANAPVSVDGNANAAAVTDPAMNGDPAADPAAADLPEGFVAVTLGTPAVGVQEDGWSYAHGMFTADQAGDYTFTAQGDADVGLYVYGDADCLTNQLGYVDMNYDAAAETLTLTLQAGQTVYLEGSYYGNNYPANVTFTASMAGGQTAAPVTTDPAGSSASAASAALPEGFVALTLGTPIFAVQEDFWGYAHAMFVADQAGTYTFTAQGSDDVSFYLYNDADCWDQLAYVDAYTDTTPETLTVTLQAGQVVYLESSYFGENYPAVVTYTAALAGGQAAAPAAAAPAASDGLAVGTPVFLTTSSSSPYCHTSYLVPSTGIYLFTATSVTDCTLALYEDADCWDQIDYADDGLEGDTECLAVNLTAGQTVYIEVYTWSDYGDVIVAVSST